MTLRYLLDENVDPSLLVAFRRRAPELTVWRVGDPGAPAFSTPDPAILVWCEQHNFVLVTNNRRSMPTHLVDHLAVGRHIPGILLINAGLSIGDTLDYLVLAAHISESDEYRDQIQHLLSL